MSQGRKLDLRFLGDLKMNKFLKERVLAIVKDHLEKGYQKIKISVHRNRFTILPTKMTRKSKYD